MPNVNVFKRELYERLGKTDDFTEDDFQDLCFQFGIELDEVTSEFEIIKNMEGEEAAIEKGASKAEIFKIDIPANRYDLLCLEGLSRGLNIFLGNTKELPLKKTKPKYEIRVTRNTAKVRPYVVGAVLRNFKMTERVYNRFIEIQEKLMFNIGRKRSIVAIGTHDLDACKPNFLYDARARQDISFKALKEEKAMTVEELFKEYTQRGEKLCSVAEFVPLLAHSKVVPVIYDSSGTVCSLPPVINSEATKISLDTKNIFIDVTATDIVKANTVLHCLCSAFVEYCDPQVVEPVTVIWDEPVDFAGKKITQLEVPTLEGSTHITSTSYINANLGTDFSPKKICQLLAKMSLLAKASGDKLEVFCPITRSDVLHPVDIVEDVAIAHGYNNIKYRLPTCFTIGAQQPLNKLSDQIRQNIAMCGFTEVLNWALVSRDDNFVKMSIEDNGETAVDVADAKFKEIEVVRTNLLPGVLKTLSINESRVSLPINLFEVSDIVLLDEKSPVGARNERRCCAVVCSNKPGGFEMIHGLLERIMQLNQVSFLYDEDGPFQRKYRLSKGVKPSLLPGRQANVEMQNSEGKWQIVGHFGIVHPRTTRAFKIAKARVVNALELNVEVFL